MLGSFHRERFRLGQALQVSFGLLVSLACSFLFQAAGWGHAGSLFARGPVSIPLHFTLLIFALIVPVFPERCR